MSKPTKKELVSLGVALAKRLTTYFPPVNEIEPLLDCDIEIRKMAEHLLARAQSQAAPRQDGKQ